MWAPIQVRSGNSSSIRLQADVLVGFGAELGGVGVNGVEPGIGIADVDHDDPDAGRPRPPGCFDPPGGVHEQPAVPAARGRPELDDLDARLQEAVQQPIDFVVGFVEGFLGDAAVEAEAVAETFPQRRDVIRRTHGNDPADAEFGGDFPHRLGLAQRGTGAVAGRRPLRRIGGPGPHQVRVNIDNRRSRVAQSAGGPRSRCR